LYGWGFNYYYQLGQGADNREDELEPVKIDIKNNKRVKHISCGYFMSAVITK
jgi:hypothetical protein